MESIISPPLIETLSLLSKNEIGHLDKFVHCQLNYYPENASGVIELFDLLKNYAPEFKDKRLLYKDRIAKVLGRNGVDRLASGLHWVVRKYIGWVYQEESHDEFYQHMGMLRFYREKKEFEKFENQFKKTEELLYSSPEKLSNAVFYKFFLAHTLKSHMMQTHQPSSDLNLLNTLHYFNTFSLIQKAQIIYNLALRTKNISIDFVGYKSFIDETEIYLASGARGIDLLRLYYQAIMIILGRDEVQPELFQSLLKEHEASLSPYDYKTLASLERQIFLKEILKGKIELTAPIFEIYKRDLDKGFIRIAELTPSTFANIVRYGCRCNELKWVEDFLQQCEARFWNDNDLYLFKLYTAYFQLYKGDLVSAKKNISFNFEDPIRKVDSKCIELMYLYQSYDQSIEAKIATFKRLTPLKWLSPERYQSFNNFALALGNLIKLNPNFFLDPNLRNSPEKYQKNIKKVIDKVKKEPTVEAIWLISHLERLKKSI